jgi:hypothetical protein
MNGNTHALATARAFSSSVLLRGVSALSAIYPNENKDSTKKGHDL